MKSPRSLPILFATAVVVAALVPVIAAAPAAAMPRPASPTGVRETAATPTSFTVRTRPADNAQRYVLIASSVKSDVFFKNLTKPSAHRAVAVSPRPQVTLRGLQTTTRPYYYRVQARNGHRTSLSGIHFGYVAPTQPQRVQAVHPSIDNTGLAVTWASEAADGFTVVQATDAKMSQDRRVYHLRGDVTEFTPYGLHTGQQYFFRVRAVNGPAQSRYSEPVTGVFGTQETQLRMMTWNVLHHQFDGTLENGNKIAPWTKRVKVVVSMVQNADPDLLVINEANDWVGKAPHRQIDTLQSRLRGTYQLADADFTINRYHPRTGNYIFYRRGMFRPLYQNGGKAHYWTLSNQHMVTYQALQDVRSGAKFLMVAVHLTHGPNTSKYNAQRKKETRRLLADVRKLKAHSAKYRDMPVIFGGDFNSFAGPNPTNQDPPGLLMREAHATDALMAAQSRVNTKFGSVNDYTRTPSHSGRIIDHFYATAGVAFRTWRQVMNLKHGKWPGTIPSDHNPILVGATLQR